jgi:hypothetical protein
VFEDWYQQTFDLRRGGIELRRTRIVSGLQRSEQPL